MARETYNDSLRRLLAHEGGYSNHPSDPGGPTKFGITIADYRRYVKPNATAADVRAMRLDEAKAIYRTKYWDALRCDELPAGLDYAVFDYGVNSGIGRAGKVLQRLAGFAGDGRISDALVAAVRRADARELIVRLCDERLAFLMRLKTWPVFGRGWSRRVAEVRAAALAMAAREERRRAGEGRTAAAAAGRSAESISGKGVVPPDTKAQRATAGGIAVAGAAAAHLAHLAGARPLVVVAIVTAAAVLAAAGWLWWRRRRKRMQEA